MAANFLDREGYPDNLAGEMLHVVVVQGYWNFELVLLVRRYKYRLYMDWCIL